MASYNIMLLFCPHYFIIIVNREYFVVKIFSDSLYCAKIKRMKYVCNINDNAVQGRLSEIYLTWKFIAWNILDTKYLRFTVFKNSQAPHIFDLLIVIIRAAFNFAYNCSYCKKWIIIQDNKI